MATATKKTATKTKTNAPAEGPVPPRPVNDGDKPVSTAGQDAIVQRLDRIIELLEGTLSVDKKGLKLDSPWWNRMLDPDR
jgi:hypothetical protein